MTNTNGSPISIKRSKQILDSGLTRLRFSLDAFTDKTYKNQSRQNIRNGPTAIQYIIRSLLIRTTILLRRWKPEK